MDGLAWILVTWPAWALLLPRAVLWVIDGRRSRRAREQTRRRRAELTDPLWIALFPED